jgi:hypothetical protein
MALTLGDALQACNAARLAGAAGLPEAVTEAFTARYRSAVQAGQALHRPAAKDPRTQGRTKQTSAFNLFAALAAL